MQIKTILFIFGTRPEAIKLAPLIRHLRGFPDRYSVKICVTAQHRQMLDQVMAAFEIAADYDLDLMTPGQTLYQSTSRIIGALEPVFAESKPDFAVVQGDTTTAFCGALAASYARVPVAHVEAGLRTGDRDHPFPEETNRVLVAHLATLHFAPTTRAAENLAREGITRGVFVTGNTGIDAVLYIRDGLPPATAVRTQIILVTAHRRENFGQPFKHICEAILRLASRGDVQVIYPVHPNPNVQNLAMRMLANHPAIQLIEPQEYIPFVDLMRRSYIILTDSGGVQEEAPSLGKPVLVLREKTERPEAVDAGTVKLVGTDTDRIVREATILLDNRQEYERRSRIHNPYGDGHASERIEAALRL